ncbi:zonadhesin-like, partial [Argonauta hians]
HRIMVNSEERSFPVLDAKDFSANFSTGWSQLSTNWGLKVEYDGLHYTVVTLPATFSNKLNGICGDCNGYKDDLHKRVNEEILHTPTKFMTIMKSYRVPDEDDALGRKCEVTRIPRECCNKETIQCEIISNSSIFDSCRANNGEMLIKNFLDSCKRDICIYGDDDSYLNTVLCRLIESLVKTSKVCPNNQIYKERALTCQPTCVDHSPICTKYTDGCVCKSGYILSGLECVPKSKCGCLKQDRYLKFQEEFSSWNCSEVTKCHGGVELTYAAQDGCSKNSHCGIKDGKRGCYCNDGYTFYKGRCETLGSPYFVRVRDAKLDAIPFFVYITPHPNTCMKKCKEIITCKSFNYDNEHNVCELFLRNAASNLILTSVNCKNKDYYQKKDIKNTIRGASISPCSKPVRYIAVNNSTYCHTLCKGYCVAFEFSENKHICNLLPNKRNTFDLYGNEQWTFYGLNV